MNRSYKSDLAAAIHDTCETLHEHGIIDQEKLREFDGTCLVCKNSFSAEEICRLRTENHVSRTVFARHLGVSREDVEAWEKGEKKPGGPECRLLALVARDGFEILKL